MGVDNHPETMQDKKVKNDPAYNTKEIMGYCYRITNPWKSLNDWNKYFNVNEDYLVQEILDRTLDVPTNPGKAYLIRKEVWEPFLHEGKFSYTYGERISYQLKEVIHQLRHNPGTRQAVMTVYEGLQDSTKLGGKARIPCSMYYQFLRRKEQGVDKLNMIYTMRSCDFYTHFPYDVALTIYIQRVVAQQLQIEEGFFQHFMGSLHAYAKDYQTKGVF